jgi:hypothetical protein
VTGKMWKLGCSLNSIWMIASGFVGWVGHAQSM